MEKWERYEGHGNPVCPECVVRYEKYDQFFGAHTYAYRPDPEKGQEYCHCCGIPAPQETAP